jgi:hypothetical protein
MKATTNPSTSVHFTDDVTGTRRVIRWRRRTSTWLRPGLSCAGCRPWRCVLPYPPLHLLSSLYGRLLLSTSSVVALLLPQSIYCCSHIMINACVACRQVVAAGLITSNSNPTTHTNPTSHPNPNSHPIPVLRADGGGSRIDPGPPCCRGWRPCA